MHDELAAALIDILENGREREQIRAGAAISRGPVLAQVDADGVDDSDDPLITEATLHRIQQSLRRIYM
jgi:hypothetical protein